MPTARVGVGSNGGPGHVVVSGAGVLFLLRVVALAALVHPQQHRAQALGREPAALQVTGSTACQRRLALLTTERNGQRESEEERRPQQRPGRRRRDGFVPGWGTASQCARTPWRRRRRAEICGCGGVEREVAAADTPWLMRCGSAG